MLRVQIKAEVKSFSSVLKAINFKFITIMQSREQKILFTEWEGGRMVRSGLPTGLGWYKANSKLTVT